jgi:hypothetical protein
MDVRIRPGEVCARILALPGGGRNRNRNSSVALD